jgi:hypothetical protein
MDQIIEKPRGYIWTQESSDIVGTICLSYSSVFLCTNIIQVDSMNITLTPTYTFGHEVYILLLQQPQWNDNFCILMVLIKVSRKNLNELMEVTGSSLWQGRVMPQACLR